MDAVPYAVVQVSIVAFPTWASVFVWAHVQMEEEVVARVSPVMVGSVPDTVVADTVVVDTVVDAVGVLVAVVHHAH